MKVQFGKKFITVTVCLITFAISPAYAAKSVFIISKHAEPSQAQAYAINGTQIDYQAQVGIDTYNPGYGAVGNAVWSDKELMFVTYEESPMIVWASTKTLKKVGEFDTGIYDLAGIAIDTNREKIYTVQRGTNNLYVYSFNQANNTLVLDNHYILEVPSGYLNAWGLALDETNGLMYISTDTESVHVYDTTDWSYDHYININVGGTNRSAVGIAVDPIRGYLYTGHWTSHNYLVRTNIATQASVEVEVTNGWYGENVLGIDVDDETGLVYCTTYHHDFRVYDWNLVLRDTETNGISGPAGVAVPSGDVSYKPDRLYLSKSDSVVDCVYPEQEFTYSIEYSGNGIGDTSVVITDTLPLEVTYINSSSGGQYDGLKHTVTWNLYDISEWESGTLRIQVVLNCHADPGGTITNVVEMEGDTYYSKRTLEDTQVCCYGGPIIYVDKDATGCNNGTSWINAYRYLQDALADANLAQKPVEIRVAQVIYKPDEDTLHPNGTGDRQATFQLINGVTIKGGYAGGGWPDPNARDIERYETILSGDLAGNDINVSDPCDLVWEPTRAENSYHVVTGSGTDKTALLDGFIVTGGNARGRYHELGGGLYNSFGGPSITNCVFMSNSAEEYGGGIYNESCPTLNNCRFIGNSAGTLGGGICNNGGAPSLKYCTFTGNSSGLAGGAMMNSHSSPTLSNCRLIGNSADYGGGMQNWFGSPLMTNCRFIENSARYNGGAMDNRYYFGGIIRNCTFSGNLAGNCGGGMCNDRSRPMLTNCIFSGNVADRGGGIGSYNISSPRLTNCILWSNAAANGREIQLEENTTLAVGYSCVQGGRAAIDDPCEGLFWGAGNIDDDPCFAGPINGDYHLKSQAGRWNPNSASWVKDDVTSPCIDAGDPASPIGLEPFPNGGRVNMGAYGGTAEASKSYFGEPVCEIIVAGDINGDCVVNFFDFAIMAFHWLEDNNPPGGRR